MYPSGDLRRAAPHRDLAADDRRQGLPRDGRLVRAQGPRGGGDMEVTSTHWGKYSFHLVKNVSFFLLLFPPVGFKGNLFLFFSRDDEATGGQSRWLWEVS